MKPVVLPMLHPLRLHPLGAYENRNKAAWDIGLLAAADSQYSLEFVRKHFNKARQHLLPIIENPSRAPASGQLRVARDEIPDTLHLLGVEQRFKIDGVKIAALLRKIPAL